jgi:hypothetical protein
MLKVEKYFAKLGFKGDELEQILAAFELQALKKTSLL